MAHILQKAGISLDEIDTVSFDMWDTILRRDCHPEEVKLSTCQLLYDFYSGDLKEGFESPFTILKERNQVEYDIAQISIADGKSDEYRIRDVLDALIDRVSTAKTSKADRRLMADRLANHEREAEMTVTRVDPTFAKILSETDGKRRLVISDFYMPSPDLKYLLARHGIVDQFDDVISSCESGLNKKSGRLYSLVEKMHDIDSTRWLHIGDSLHSDVEMARSSGLKAHHHYIVAEEMRRKQFTQSFQTRPLKSDNLASALDLSEKSRDNSLEAALFHDCATLGPAIAAWTYMLTRHARKVGTNTIFCVGPAADLQKAWITSANAVLPAERQLDAVSVPINSSALKYMNMPRLTTEYFSHAWIVNGDRTPRAFLSQLGLKAERFSKVVDSHALQLDKNISSLNAPAFQNLLADPRLTDQLKQFTDNDVRNLRDYLGQNGVPENGVVLIADFFGDEALRNNIQFAYPSISVHTYEITDPAARSIVGSNSNVFAYLFGGANGPVAGLTRVTDNQKALVHAVYDPITVSDEKAGMTKTFQAGLGASLQRYLLQIVRRSLDENEAYQLMAPALRNFIHNPSPTLARAWLDRQATGHTTQQFSLYERLQSAGWNAA